MPYKIKDPSSTDSTLTTRYDEMADRYDRERNVSESTAFINRIQIRVITKWVFDRRESLVLDIPCGTGRLTVVLAHLFKRVIAGDISTGMIAVANNKIRSKGINNVALLRTNSRRLPFPERTFDIVLCVNFFHLIPSNEKHIFMGEFRRVLKPRGRLILENVSPIYGQLDRLVRHRLSLSEIPGKLVLLGQDLRLFRGFRKMRELGFGFPLFARLAGVFGESTIIKITLALGTIPFIKFLGYTIIVELEKEANAL